MRLAHRWWRSGSDGGPVAVLIHGGTGSAETWWRVAPSLVAAGWRVLGLDLRGHGASPHTGTPYTVPELAADVAETMASLDIGAIDLVWGHSLGAITTLTLMASSPDLVRRAILEEPADSRPGGWAFYAPHVRSERDAVLRDPTAFSRGLIAENPRWTDADALVAVLGILSCDTDALAASCERGLEYNTLQLIRSLRVPSLLMLGRTEAGSVLLEPERSAVLAARSPDSVVELDSGHTLHRDRFDDCIGRALGWLHLIEVRPFFASRKG